MSRGLLFAIGSVVFVATMPANWRSRAKARISSNASKLRSGATLTSFSNKQTIRISTKHSTTTKSTSGWLFIT